MGRTYTVDEVLGSMAAMDDLIHALAHNKLANATGGAYRSVKLAAFRDGVLLCSAHHVDRTCAVAITERPGIGFRRGCQDSAAYGDPMPRPTEGEWVWVWSRGRWVKDGPWVQPVRDAIAFLIADLEAAEREAAVGMEAKRAAAHAAADARTAAIESAWSAKT